MRGTNVGMLPPIVFHPPLNPLPSREGVKAQRGIKLLPPVHPEPLEGGNRMANIAHLDSGNAPLWIAASVGMTKYEPPLVGSPSHPFVLREIEGRTGESCCVPR